MARKHGGTKGLATRVFPGRWSFTAALSVCLIVATGCAQLNNPWKDSSAVIDADMTTASAQGYSGKTEFAALMVRSSPQETVYYENGVVTHWPLWFEDPFEDKGNDVTTPGDRDPIDNHFALNWVDYMYLGYGPGRFLLNTVAWPISAIVTPPGTLMESDGRLSKGLAGYDHDAKRSNPATREPPDFNVIEKAPLTEPEAEPIIETGGEQLTPND